MSTHDVLNESWFIKPVGAKVKPVERDPIEVAPPPKAAGRVGWAIGIGTIGGAVGGAIMLVVADAIARRFDLDVDILQTVGRFALELGLDGTIGGLASAVSVGAVVGALFGLLTRYSLRLVPRILTGIVLAPALWTFFHAFVLKSHLADSLAGLPFGPMVGGAVAFGLCATILPPPRQETQRRPASGGTQ